MTLTEWLVVKEDSQGQHLTREVNFRHVTIESLGDPHIQCLLRELTWKEGKILRRDEKFGKGPSVEKATKDAIAKVK